MDYFSIPTIEGGLIKSLESFIRQSKMFSLPAAMDEAYLETLPLLLGLSAIVSLISYVNPLVVPVNGLFKHLVGFNILIGYP